MIPVQPTACVQEVRTHGSCSLVIVCGEIDLLTAPGLVCHLDWLTYTGRPDLLIDLRPVSFMDTSGIKALARARDRATGRCGKIRLVCTRPATLRLLHHPVMRLGLETLEALPSPEPPHVAA
ncbi:MULTISPECIES: STAS domain-containing protein [unclassified Streptomyces]|uniref:STAS domain-containing protein n=1 Tax=unclassified Streptomyces TaxID=2593676 RepID=UPI00332B15A6